MSSDDERKPPFDSTKVGQGSKKVCFRKDASFIDVPVVQEPKEIAISSSDPPKSSSSGTSRPGHGSWGEKKRKPENSHHIMNSYKNTSLRLSSKRRERRYRDKMNKYDTNSTRANSSRFGDLDAPLKEPLGWAQDPENHFGTVEPEDDDPLSSSSSEEIMYTPGAFSVSETNDARPLRKGSLTLNLSTDESIYDAEVERFEDAKVERFDDEVTTSSAPKPKWYRRLMAMIMIALIAVIAIGVAVPLSKSEPSTDPSSDAQDPTLPKSEGWEEGSADPPEEPTINTTARADAVRSLISLIYPNTSLLDQSGSPQYLALNWIIYEDELSPIEQSTFTFFHNGMKLMQRYALAVFFHSSQGSPLLSSSETWLNGRVDECEWEFISCNSFGEVSSISTHFSAFKYDGALPGEISLLSSIHTLELPGNAITDLPNELSTLTNLVKVDFDNNNFPGIPSVIYKMSSLESISLTNNLVGGTISSSISNLSMLTHLDLNSNNLGGNLTEMLVSLTNLVSLDLRYNEIRGTIPSEIGNMQNLASLDLKTNKISSTIPTEVGIVTSLTSIGLGSNEIEGTIPKELANLSNLEQLRLASNPIVGPFPTELCALRSPVGNLAKLSTPCSTGCTCCTFCSTG